MKRLHKQAPVYNAVRSNYVWPDHVLRLMVTAGMVAWFEPKSVVDPACGDASIVMAANRLRPIEHAHLGDISQAQIVDLWGKDLGVKASLWTGDALEFLKRYSGDVVILTEILEHVEEPDVVLKQARQSGRFLVASSPLDESEDSGNHEHLWSWSKYDYEDMLKMAGWEPMSYIELSFTAYPYTFQVWGCG